MASSRKSTKKFQNERNKKRMVIYTADFMQRIPEGVILSMDYRTIWARSTGMTKYNAALAELATYKTPERAQDVMLQMYEAEARGDRVFIMPRE